jgi:hypothetical protein
MSGNKDLKEEDLNISAFIPTGAEGYIPPHSRKKKEKPKSGMGDISTIMSALGASDGRKRR